MKIKKIRKRHYKGKVYDLTVANTHTYNIEGLAVHNSVGGSLIAYMMGISEVDPIKYNLMFSRFISEDRSDLPDIDLDFEDTKRDLVIAHIKELYGEDNVCGISTFMKMKSRGVVRDVSRVFEIPYPEVDEFAKAIEIGGDIQDCIDNTDEGKSFHRSHPKVTKFAMALENQIRGSGRHAAAIIVSSESLKTGERCNLCNRHGNIVSNLSMSDCDFSGLMKLDILGLKTLSVLSYTKKLIRRTSPDFNFRSIPFDDPDVYLNINEGNTAGAFQISTPFSTHIAKDIKANNFNDLPVILALARPGPFESGMTENYINRKNGKEWDPLHPIYEKITEDTFGVIVFQEQVMKVICEVAGMSEAESYKILKVIGKKRDEAEFLPYQEKFIFGCRSEDTLSRSEAVEFWEGLKKHARYSFNKCLAGDTLIDRGSAGRYAKDSKITIKEFFEKWHSNTSTGKKYRDKNRGINILQLSEDGLIRPAKVKNVFLNGVQNVYEVETEDGFKIKGTKTHKLLTRNGYETIGSLSLQDIIITTKKLRKTRYVADKGCSTERAKGKTYTGKGFQDGSSNPSYKDGRTKQLKRTKEIVKKRSQDKCENCNIEYNGGRFEFAHILPLDFYCGDYLRYHGPDNVAYLCNNCHKEFDYIKKERKKRFTHGYKTGESKIISIKYAGKEQTYDIEMDTEEHNYIANGIVSHNSHSVAYSFLTYWTMYCKLLYPTEFISSSLTYSDKTEEMIAEARRLKLNVLPPKMDISEPIKWTANRGTLYAPFIEIKGVGEKQAEKICSGSKGKKKGFAKLQADTHTKGKLRELLVKVGCYEKTNIPEGIDDLFSFPISGQPPIPFNKIKLAKARIRNDEVEDCDQCEMGKRCPDPLLSNFGNRNLAIVGSYPTIADMKQKRNFAGDAGKILWDELKQYGMTKNNFFLCNILRCHSRDVKKPSFQQIDTCSKWTKNEIKVNNIKVVLCLGGSALYGLTGKKSGIMNLCGDTVWDYRLNAYICYGMTPGSVFASGKNKELFEKGIENFASTINKIGGK